MKKVTFIFLIISIILFSCTNRVKKLNGHWHEFESDNPISVKCIKITDSTLSINENTDGVISKRVNYDLPYIWYLDSTDISKAKISKNKIVFNDKLKWIRQEENNETFISDFSIGLSVDIYPPEKDSLQFDLTDIEGLNSLIFIGKLKKEAFANSVTFDLNSNKVDTNYREIDTINYHIQLNDKISKIEDIPRYLFGGHRKIKEQNIIISADRETPKNMINEIEKKIMEFGITKTQIYYLNIDSENNVGYNYH